MNARSPLTGSADVTLLATIPAERLIRDWANNYRIDVSGDLRGHAEIHLLQCNRTGLRFFHPPDVAGSGRFYGELQKFDWYYMEDKWEHRVALADLSRCRNILEIGAGFGAFVQAGLRAGLAVRGLELNEAAVRIAQERDLPVQRLDLREVVERDPGAFDGVCAFQVLEHVPDPGAFIGRAVRLLSPGGTLILSVPNAESFLKRGYFLEDMPPHHMTRWSGSTLRALPALFPLAVEALRREPLAPYHVSTYLSAHADHYRARSPFWKIFFNRYSGRVYRMVLDGGWRRMATGMTLYARFRKV